MTTCYSYIRFSQTRQSLGDSHRRQVAAAEAYAAQHGYQLEPRIEDLGVSAWTGANAEAGALSLFLEECKPGGRIPHGSWLIVENLDRITRQSLDVAIRLLLQIISLGITIVTLQDNRKYNSETIRETGGTNLIIAITVLSRGHEESETKSKRIRAINKKNLEEAKLTKKPITRRCPSWLRYDDESDSWRIIEEKAAIVRNIIAWSIAGDGGRVIAKRLNASNTPLMGHPHKQDGIAWSDAHVWSLISKRAMVGERVSKNGYETIHGYYPAIVSIDEYNLAREIKANRTRISLTKSNWLLAGLMWCACGAKMRTSGPRQHCQSQYHAAGCNSASVSHTIVSNHIIRWFLNLHTVEKIVLVDDAEILKTQLTDLKKRQQNLINMMDMVDDNTAIVPKYDAVTAEIKEKQSLLSGIRPVRPLSIVYKRIIAICNGLVITNAESPNTVIVDGIWMDRTTAMDELKLLFQRAITRITLDVNDYYSDRDRNYYRKITITGEIEELLQNNQNVDIRITLPPIGASNSKRIASLNKGKTIRTDIGETQGPLRYSISGGQVNTMGVKLSPMQRRIDALKK